MVLVDIIWWNSVRGTHLVELERYLWISVGGTVLVEKCWCNYFCGTVLVEQCWQSGVVGTVLVESSNNYHIVFL